MSKDQTQQPPAANPFAAPTSAAKPRQVPNGGSANPFGAQPANPPSNPDGGAPNPGAVDPNGPGYAAYYNSLPASTRLYLPAPGSSQANYVNDRYQASLADPNAAHFGSPGTGNATPGSGTGSSANAPAPGASPFAPSGNNPFGSSSAASNNTSGATANGSLPASPFAPKPGTNPFQSVYGPGSGGGQASGSIVGTGNNAGNGSGAYSGSTVNGGTAPPPAIPYGSIQNKLDTSKVPSLVGGDALAQMMQQAQAAAYKQATAYLDPQWANAQHDLETRLANQGIPIGSEAYTRAMEEFNRNKAFAYSNAEQSAVQQGNTAQAQLFGEGLASNQNAFGQALSGGNFSNAAQDQITRQILANLGFNEQVSQNNFSDSMATRQQDINELLLQQQNPLQMYQALTQGNGVTPPNFTNTPGANVNGTDIASIIAQALQQGNNVYNTQVGAQNSNTSAYAAIIAALLSDRRFKRNVRMIGMHEVGVPLYAFEYVWGEPAVGVMADEVAKVKPSAVIELPNGMLAVNYAEFSKVA